ncbi:MAG: hypothetical protein R2713_14910 [Ilumatobacteraceae bacterium]
MQQTGDDADHAEELDRQRHGDAQQSNVQPCEGEPADRVEQQRQADVGGCHRRRPPIGERIGVDDRGQVEHGLDHVQRHGGRRDAQGRARRGRPRPSSGGDHETGCEQCGADGEQRVREHPRATRRHGGEFVTQRLLGITLGVLRPSERHGDAGEDEGNPPAGGTKTMGHDEDLRCVVVEMWSRRLARRSTMTSTPCTSLNANDGRSEVCLHGGDP